MASIQRRKVGDMIYLYLDYTDNNGQRHQDSMSLKIVGPFVKGPKGWIAKPKNIVDKIANEEAERAAQSMLSARVMELNGFKSGLVSNEQKNIDIIIGFKEWTEAYSKKDYRSAQMAYNWFNAYCDEMGIRRLNSATLVVSFIDDYGLWLNSQYVTKGTGTNKKEVPMAKESRVKIFRKLRTYLTKLFKDGFVSWPPQLISAKWKRDKAKVKKLTPRGNELDLLIATPKPHDEICRAFLFCINTAFDYITVHEHICWRNISSDYQITFERSKTGKENGFKLNKTAIECLGPRGDDSDLVFTLPSHRTCIKWIRRWFANAGIKNADQFTWHSARHTLGMILGNEKGISPAVLKEMYGHSDIKETMKYFKAYHDDVDAAFDMIG